MTAKYVRWVHGVLHVAGPLVSGGAIYLLYRETDLRVFQWADFMGIAAAVEWGRQLVGSIRPPNLVIYSLPGALWLYAFTSLMALVWRGSSEFRPRILWMLVPACVAAGSEGVQWLGLTDGTFDLGDVGLYTVAALAAFARFGRSHRETEAGSRSPDLRSRHRLSFVCTVCFSLIIAGADVLRGL